MHSCTSFSSSLFFLLNLLPLYPTKPLSLEAFFLSSLVDYLIQPLPPLGPPPYGSFTFFCLEHVFGIQLACGGLMMRYQRFLELSSFGNDIFFFASSSLGWSCTMCLYHACIYVCMYVCMRWFFLYARGNRIYPVGKYVAVVCANEGGVGQRRKEEKEKKSASAFLHLLILFAMTWSPALCFSLSLSHTHTPTRTNVFRSRME